MSSDFRGGLTADVGVLVRVVPTVVDEVTQVVLGDAVAIGAGVLLWCTREAWRQRRGAVQETDVIHHHVAHVADPSLGSEHHLTNNNNVSFTRIDGELQTQHRNKRAASFSPGESCCPATWRGRTQTREKVTWKLGIQKEP